MGAEGELILKKSDFSDDPVKVGHERVNLFYSFIRLLFYILNK